MKIHERETLREDFPEILRNAMCTNQQSYESVAKKIGTSREYVRQALLGLSSLDKLKDICKVLSIDFNTLKISDESSLSIADRYPRFLRVNEVSIILNILPRQVYDMVNDGQLKHITIGRKGIRILESSLQDFINKQL